MQKFKLVATEFDFTHEESLVIDINARDNMSENDVLEAIRKSCADFCKTEYGRGVYTEHYGVFGYGDFDVYVPNEICQKYGITKVKEPDRMLVSDLNLSEQLVNEEEIEAYWEEKDEKEY